MRPAQSPGKGCSEGRGITAGKKQLVSPPGISRGFSSARGLILCNYLLHRWLHISVCAYVCLTHICHAETVWKRSYSVISHFDSFLYIYFLRLLLETCSLFANTQWQHWKKITACKKYPLCQVEASSLCVRASTSFPSHCVPGTSIVPQHSRLAGL